MFALYARTEKLATNPRFSPWLCLPCCDNPICIRFTHLFEGNDQANSDDKWRKDRGHSLLTTEQVLEIRKALLNGRKGAHLAVEYNTSETAICRIKNRESWKEI